MRISHPRRPSGLPVTAGLDGARSVREGRKITLIAHDGSRWEMHKPAFHEVPNFALRKETRKPLDTREIIA